MLRTQRHGRGAPCGYPHITALKGCVVFGYCVHYGKPQGIAPTMTTHILENYALLLMRNISEIT
jgi:hypothetical protein